MRSVIILAAVVVFLAACAPQTLHERVPDVPGEVLYEDILLGRVPADEASFFGVSLGDSEEAVRSLHGEPDVEREYRFGTVRNLEYSLGQNETVVLYHFERGVVESVLLTQDANPLLVNNTRLTQDRADIYGLLGLPTLTEDIPPERVFYYDALGYEVFLRRGEVDRLFATWPDRGIVPAGRSVNASMNVSE